MTSQRNTATNNNGVNNIYKYALISIKKIGEDECKNQANKQNNPKVQRLSFCVFFYIHLLKLMIYCDLTMVRDKIASLLSSKTARYVPFGSDPILTIVVGSVI